MDAEPQYVSQRKNRKQEEQSGGGFNVVLISQETLPKLYCYSSWCDLVYTNIAMFLSLFSLLGLIVMFPNELSYVELTCCLLFSGIYSVWKLHAVFRECYDQSLEDNEEYKLTIICGLFSFLLCYSLSGTFGNLFLDVGTTGGFHNIIDNGVAFLVSLGYEWEGSLDYPYISLRILFCMLCSLFCSFTYITSRRRVSIHQQKNGTDKYFYIIYALNLLIILSYVKPFINLLEHYIAWRGVKVVNLVRPSIPLLVLLFQSLPLREHLQSHLISQRFVELLQFMQAKKHLIRKGTFYHIHTLNLLLHLPVVAIELVGLEIFLVWMGFLQLWWSNFLIVILVAMKIVVSAIFYGSDILPSLEVLLRNKLTKKQSKTKKKIN
eukprot:TRINITY_DN5869_c0_g1_i1.p1 TRINITY_DN5869_c0_g1~~TRINITY_DN5869_c0_g1_i1.p1  ORF type:complete len:444 (+),score=92.08 TRINITY_DN5869_c0_g1_i1:199-1332(+)